MSILHTLSDEERSRYKTQKLKDIRDYNSDLISDLGISPMDFNMKTQFYDEQRRLVVGIFPSEFKKAKGFYFELIDSDLNPIDSERKVYRVPFNASYADEYELNSKGSYLVPLDELRVVNRDSVAISKYSALATGPDDELFKNKTSIPKAPAPIEDAPYADMTIRDYFAIHTGKPVSAKVWLNDLIRNSK